MDIYIQSEIGTCADFKAGVKEQSQTVTIDISPLTVDEMGTGGIRVTTGCNMWQACCNRRCHFSGEARKLPKIKGAAEATPLSIAKG